MTPEERRAAEEARVRAEEAKREAEQEALAREQRAQTQAQRIVVTAGDLSVAYEILGEVAVDTTGYQVLRLGDLLFRSDLERALNPRPEASQEELFGQLKLEAARRWPDEEGKSGADAVINATYYVDARGEAYARGVAVRFGDSR